MSAIPQSHSNWITKNQKTNPAEYGRYARKAVQPQVIRVCIVTLYVSVVAISVQHIQDYKTGKLLTSNDYGHQIDIDKKDYLSLLNYIIHTIDLFSKIPK